MNRKKRFWLLIISVILVYIIFLNFISFFLDNRAFVLVTQKWKEFHSLVDWNLTGHAIVDIDNDGRLDELTFGGCAYLSSSEGSVIPKEDQCKQTEFLVEPAIDKNRTGQSLEISIPTIKSFIVKTRDNSWKYYNYGFLKFYVEELKTNGLFKPINPTFLDIIDYLIYFSSHILLRFIPF